MLILSLHPLIIFRTKFKFFLGYIPNYTNAKSLACDTANDHAIACTRKTMAMIYVYIIMYSNCREHYSDR